MSKPNDLVQGTLDLLLLKILALEPLHGWAISLRLRSISGDVLQVSEGSLYPALHKLEQEGWIAAEWKQTENNRRAKFYALTRLGRRQLEAETANWDRLSSAISHVVRLKEA
jgi:PadR family transcriptional regulator